MLNVNNLTDKSSGIEGRPIDKARMPVATTLTLLAALALAAGINAQIKTVVEEAPPPTPKQPANVKIDFTKRIAFPLSPTDQQAQPSPENTGDNSTTSTLPAALNLLAVASATVETAYTVSNTPQSIGYSRPGQSSRPTPPVTFDPNGLGAQAKSQKDHR